MVDEFLQDGIEFIHGSLVADTTAIVQFLPVISANIGYTIDRLLAKKRGKQS
jgi:hypothetical protein